MIFPHIKAYRNKLEDLWILCCPHCGAPLRPSDPGRQKPEYRYARPSYAPRHYEQVERACGACGAFYRFMTPAEIVAEAGRTYTGGFETKTNGV